MEPRDLFDPGSAQPDRFARNRRGIDVDNSFEDPAPGHFLDQHGNPIGGTRLGPAIGSALEPVRRFGVEAQLSGSRPDGTRVEIGGLDQHISRS